MIIDVIKQMGELATPIWGVLWNISRLQVVLTGYMNLIGFTLSAGLFSLSIKWATYWVRKFPRTEYSHEDYTDENFFWLSVALGIASIIGMVACGTAAFFRLLNPDFGTIQEMKALFLLLKVQG